MLTPHSSIHTDTSGGRILPTQPDALIVWWRSLAFTDAEKVFIVPCKHPYPSDNEWWCEWEQIAWSWITNPTRSPLHHHDHWWARKCGKCRYGGAILSEDIRSPLLLCICYDWPPRTAACMNHHSFLSSSWSASTFFVFTLFQVTLLHNIALICNESNKLSYGAKFP